MKWTIKLALLLLLVLTPGAWSQVATITGQATDTDNQNWFSGTYTIKWINPQPGFTAYRSDTLAPFPQSFLGSLDSTGSFSVQLTQTNFIVPAGSNWQFTICSAVTGWSCGTFTIPITASGSVSSQISAAIKAPRVTGGPGIQAYQDIEVAAFPNNSYFNLVSQVNRCYSTVWAVCQSGGGGNVTSVFGRTGVVVAVNGDYTCSEVTGCVPNAVPSVFGRTGAITAQSGDYTCSQVTGCLTSAPVTSVFGRTGAITSQSGDYTCSQVTGCGLAPTVGWENQVAANQTSSATTLVLTGSGGLPTSGTFFVDGEYEAYTSVNYGTNTLSGISRGQNSTTAAAHTAGAEAVSVNLMFAPLAIGGIFSNSYTLAINNGFPQSGSPFVVNSGGNELDVTSTGAILQYNNSAFNYFGNIEVGVPGAHNDGTNYVIPITNTSALVQDNAAHELQQPIGDSAGFAGTVSSIPAPTIGSLSLYPQFINTGTCNITYVVTGVDVDGVEVPGTPTSISNLAPWTVPAGVTIRYPSAAGVVSYNGYRTAVSSGCTGLALGKFASGITGNYGVISDQYTGGDSTTPPSTNNSVAKLCTGSTTNNDLWCSLAGASSTPPISCTSAQAGWNYYNTAATTAPYYYQCIASTWIPGSSGNVSQTGTPINGQIAVWAGSGLLTAATPTGTGSPVQGIGPTIQSPALTGTPTAPTQGTCASNTDIATGAYVANCGGSFASWLPGIIFSAAGTPVPTCTSGIKGTMVQVSDATSPTYLGTYTPGGAVLVPALCNGTAWITH